MGDKPKSERFRAATLHQCGGWVKAVSSAAGHSFLPAAVGSPRTLMAALAARSMALQSRAAAQGNSLLLRRKLKRVCPEEPLLCRSNFPTAQPCSKRQPFVTVRSHSFRETKNMIWCLFLFVLRSGSN